MERISVELTLPGDLVDALEEVEDQVEHRLRLPIALELFREEKISSGKAVV